MGLLPELFTRGVDTEDGHHLDVAQPEPEEDDAEPAEE